MTISSRLALAGLASLGILAAVAPADAGPRRERALREGRSAYLPVPERTITVTRRSFLDSGNVVPVGSTNAYVQQIWRFERPPLANTSPGILWRPDPGPGEPIF